MLKVKKLEPEAIIPTRGTAKAAGLDLYALLEGTVPAGKIKKVRTGISIELPEGFEGQVRPRSGLAAKHGVTVLNAPGTVDEDYRGEVQVILVNHGEEDFTFKAGDRIAQLIVAPVSYVPVLEVEELSDSNRGAGGFGSTGK